LEATGSLTQARIFHTATLLPDQTVLVAGGSTNSSLGSAELYHPGTGTWTNTGGLAVARDSFTATLLGNGQVLAVGGRDLIGAFGASIATVELYDPASQTWLATGDLRFSRAAHTAILLPDGNVIIAGGWYSDGTSWGHRYPKQKYPNQAEAYLTGNSRGE
jgi:hypothetical protein